MSTFFSPISFSVSVLYCLHSLSSWLPSLFSTPPPTFLPTLKPPSNLTPPPHPPSDAPPKPLPLPLLRRRNTAAPMRTSATRLAAVLSSKISPHATSPSTLRRSPPSPTPSTRSSTAPSPAASSTSSTTSLPWNATTEHSGVTFSTHASVKPLGRTDQASGQRKSGFFQRSTTMTSSPPSKETQTSSGPRGSGNSTFRWTISGWNTVVSATRARSKILAWLFLFLRWTKNTFYLHNSILLIIFNLK